MGAKAPLVLASSGFPSNLQAGDYLSGATLGSGSSLPASPTAGTYWLYTPTGRTWLMLWDGSAWQALQAFGTTTLYVDGASGTDNNAHGSASGASAYATIGFALARIPPVCADNVTINLDSGTNVAHTYSESVSIPQLSIAGGGTLSIVGNLLVLDNNVTINTGTSTVGGTPNPYTEATLVKASGVWLTTGGHQLVKCTTGSGANNGAVRLIDTGGGIVALTICGSFSAFSTSPTESFTTYDWGSIISASTPVTVRGTQAVSISNVKMLGSSIGINCGVSSNVTLTACAITPGAGAYGVYTGNNAFVALTSCYVWAGGNSQLMLLLNAGSNGNIYGSKFDLTGFTNGSCVYMTNAMLTYVGGINVYAGNSSTSTGGTGMNMNLHSTAYVVSSQMTKFFVGIQASTGSVANPVAGYVNFTTVGSNSTVDANGSYVV